jgi:hypothetical protein
MPGLPFFKMPAAQAGDVRLGGMLGGEMGTPVYSEQDYQRTPDPSGRPVVEMAPSPTPAQTTLPTQAAPGTDTDLFAMNDQLRDVQSQPIANFYQQREAAIRGGLQQELDAKKREYEIERGYVKSPEERATLEKKYDLIVERLRSGAAPDLQAISSQAQQAKMKLDLDHAERALRLQQVQSMADKGLIDPDVAKQEQFGIMGYSIPLPQTQRAQTPIQRLGELRPIYSDLLKQSGQYKKYPTGWRVYDESAHERYRNSPDRWYPTAATPNQVAEAEDIHTQLRDVRVQIDELNATVGRRPSLVESTVDSPMAAAVRLAKTAKAVTDRYWPLSTEGSGGGETRIVNGQRFQKVGSDQWVPME